MTRKIELNEDEFKNIILMMKLSGKYLQIPPNELRLFNIWRVAPKLADKLLKRTQMQIVQNKGRISVKPITEETPVVDTPKENTPKVDENDEHRPLHHRKRKSK